MVDTPRAAGRRIQRSRGFRIAARTGYSVNGLLNLLIGVIAITVAVGGGSGEEASQGGALQRVTELPAGGALIWIVAVGMAALGVWQLVSAVVEDDPDASKRRLARVKSVGKGVAYLAIAASAVPIALGGGSGGGGSGGGAEESLTARLLSTPGGVVLVVAIGLAAVGIGGYLVVKGVRQKFLDDLTPPSGTARTGTVVLGTVGYIARGVAIAIIGVLFVIAAATADPEAAGGLDDALATLASLPLGKVLLVIVGAGFIAYGLYSFVRARFAKL